MHASVEGAGAGDSSVMSEAVFGEDAVSGSGPRGAVVPVASAVCCSSLEGSRAGDAMAEDMVGVGGLDVVPVVSATCHASVEGSRVGGAVAEDSIGGSSEAASSAQPLLLLPGDIGA